MFDPVFANIIPSFFVTLRDLYTAAHHPGHHHQFDNLTIVLRTFGSDLNDLRKAIHLFASGLHPDFPDFVEPKLQMNINDDFPPLFVNGRWVLKDPSHAMNEYEYQLTLDDGTVIASGDKAVLDFLHSQVFCGIQDDYEHWSKHGWEPWAGKPVWVPYRSNDADTHYHHVLFDDNMYGVSPQQMLLSFCSHLSLLLYRRHNLVHDSIASVRREINPGEFESLTGNEILEHHGKHLVKVHTILPILDEAWFMNEILKVCRVFSDC